MKYKKLIVSYLVIGGLPILIMLFVFASLRIYPFGTKSILSGDLLGQYNSIMNYIGGGRENSLD